MEESQIIIREMKLGVEKKLLKVAKNAFRFIESLFVSKPETAMVAEYDGVIVSGMIYNIIDSSSKKIAYVDEAFVDFDYQGSGIGRKLYNKTFEHLWNLNCDVITAMVKDDNVGSWKLLEGNHFKKESFNQIIKEIGFLPLLLNLFGCTFIMNGNLYHDAYDYTYISL